MKKHVPEIDIARGISIAFIVFYHYFLELSRFHLRPIVGSLSTNISRLFILPWSIKLSLVVNPLSAIFSFGWEFVGVFLFLSGFTLYYSKKTSPPSTNSFLVKRLRSLVPAWQIAIAFAFVINLIFSWVFRSYIITVPSTKIVDYLYLLLYPVVVDSAFQRIPGVNPSLWFMSLLFQFYLIFEVVYLFCQKYGIKKVFWFSLLIDIFSRVILVFVLNGIPSSLSAGVPKNYQAFTLFPARLFEFVAGMYLAQIFIDTGSFKTLTKKYALPVGIIFWLLGNMCNYFVAGWVLSDTLLTIGLVIIVFNGLALFKDFKHNTLFSILGKNSIWIYLLHNQPITQILVPLTFLIGQRLPLSLSIILSFLILGIIIAFSTKLPFSPAPSKTLLVSPTK
ncbi:acyltransferase family protein [Patescibacteria group bacterium]|nr:acyltransferase family protein [Patescibacteria group bacterium]